MTGLAEISKFKARLQTELAQDAAGDKAAELEKRRALFGTYGGLWKSAEVAGDTAALSELEALRPLLQLPRPPRPSLFHRISMILRLLLTVLVMSWGCLCVLALTPLRLLHPTLRRCGVPNGLLPLDVITMLLFRAVLAAMGVKVRVVEGSWRECWGSRPCGIIVYNHASNLDPLIVNLVCRGIGPKFVGKKAVFKMPIFGWLCLLVGMVPINRGDREKAVKTMNETVARIMERWGRCVAISPEGTRTTDGNLVLPFKKGVFHLQEHTGSPLLPVIIHGAYELWPPSQLFTTQGEVRVSLLPAQRMPESGGCPREGSRVQLQSTIAEHMGERASWGARPLSFAARLENLVVLVITFTIFLQLHRLYLMAAAAVGLTTCGMLVMLIATTLVVAWVVDQFL